MDGLEEVLSTARHEYELRKQIRAEGNMPPPEDPVLEMFDCLDRGLALYKQFHMWDDVSR